MSPLATGGAGHIFEYRIAAIMLAHLLGHTRPPGLEVELAKVGMQQRALGYDLDDIVLYAESGPLTTEFQVKLTVTVTPSDREFLDFVSQALQVLEGQADEVARGEVEVGLIAEGDATAMAELKALAEKWAQQHAKHETFGAVIAPGLVKEQLRTRLRYVERVVELAIEQGAPDLGGVGQTTHALLSVLRVWCPSVGDDGADLRGVLDQLRPIADGYENTTPVDLFGHLEALARGSGPAAGVVDTEWVRRRLHRRGLVKKSEDAAAIVKEIDAEAVVSGPLEALDLQRQVDEAEALLDKGDAKAVEIFGEVAERLKNSLYEPHATIMLRKRATALQAAGLHDEATIARVGLAWDDLDRVRVWEAGWALHDSPHANAGLSLNASTERALAAADAAVWTARGADLQQIAAAFDALESSDSYRDRAAVFLAEEAIAADRNEIVIDRLEELRSIADGIPKSAGEAARIRAVRLRMCLADVTGEWTDLLRQVRRDPWRIVAWVEARYARYLALSGDGAGAMEQYLDAIEHATAKEMFDDAADWLYALRTVRYLDGQFSADEEHPLAQALRPHAKASTLPGSPHTKELALQAMLDKEEPAEALQRVERWRWQAVVRAELTDEFRAIEAVGTLQEKGGDLDDAIKSYVRAGSAKKAKTAAGKLPDDRPARLDLSLLTSGTAYARRRLCSSGSRGRRAR